MKEKRVLIIRTIYLLSLLILYYIVGNRNIFTYVLSLSIYNIFSSCLDNIDITTSLNKYKSIKTKNKLFKIITLSLILITLIFTLISISISDITNILLGINDSLLIFILMSISVISLPFIKIYTSYLENITNIKLQDNTLFIYHILENILLIIIAIFTFLIFKLNINIAISLLYLSKILSLIFIIIILYLITKNKQIKDIHYKETINYKLELKYIYLSNYPHNLINIITNSYYYISIIVLYYILNTKYSYQTDIISSNITFIYLYGINIVNYLIYIIKLINKEIPITMSIPLRIYQNIKFILPISIIMIIISPLTCKIIFNNPDYSIYFVMTNILAIFILLYDITNENIKNNKVLLISLFSGIIAKIILIVPLINSFYRMGSNLIYGDILSTILGMFLSVIINYIYIRNKTKVKEKYFEKILDIIYSNIILSIILILLEFIIPIDTNNYFKSLGLLIIYLFVGITIIKIRNKKIINI